MIRDPDAPQWAFPFQLGPDGQPLEVVQDSAEDVRGSVELLLNYPLGFRDDAPDFGIADPTFEVVTSATVEDVEAAIEQWEPRALALVDGEVDVIDEALRRITVRLRREEGAGNG